MPSTTPPERPLRKDAERSRQRVVEAATTVYAAKGLDAGFDEIARVAGVGVGTVYRRFPAKEGLLEEVLITRIARVVELADQALAREDAWDALVWFFEQFILEQRRDLGLAQLVARHDLPSARLTSQRAEVTRAVDGVIERAQRLGAARQDLSTRDFVILMTLVTRVAAADDSELWRRYFGLLLDVLRPEPTRTAPSGPEPTHEIVERLLDGL